LQVDGEALARGRVGSATVLSARSGEPIDAPELNDLVDVYLSQHGGEPETVEKLRWLLAKAVCAFGERRINQLRPAEIAAWRMTIRSGHRFEATQALPQVLARAVS
jgi:hypothetical protein